MNKYFIGNDEAYHHILSYTRMVHPGPLILLGKRGLGKKKAAISLAAHLLGCEEESLRQCKDFTMIDKGKDAIKVEDILSFLDKSTFASLSAVKVYLLCQADRINAQAQNKLLKLLEDRNQTNIVIFLCERDSLLPTIKSRCMTVEFSALKQEEMERYLKDSGITQDVPLISALCDRCPYLLDEVKEVYPSLREVYSNILSIKRREDLLRVFHLVAEKDTQEFYASHGDHYMTALQMLQHLYYSLLCAKISPSPDGAVEKEFGGLMRLYSVRDALLICTAVSRHQNQWLSGVYSKNDFFDLVRVMI